MQSRWEVPGAGDRYGAMQHLLSLYDQFGILLAEETGASDSLLHVHAGMTILLLARLVTRRSLATWVPFSTTLLAALANEIADRLVQGHWILPDALFDIFHTIWWPFILMIGLKLRSPRGAGRK